MGNFDHDRRAGAGYTGCIVAARSCSPCKGAPPRPVASAVVWPPVLQGATGETGHDGSVVRRFLCVRRRKEDLDMTGNASYWHRVVAMISVVLVLIVMAPKGVAQASTTTRPISDFVRAQGTFCIPD